MMFKKIIQRINRWKEEVQKREKQEPMTYFEVMVLVLLAVIAFKK